MIAFPELPAKTQITFASFDPFYRLFGEVLIVATSIGKRVLKSRAARLVVAFVSVKAIFNEGSRNWLEMDALSRRSDASRAD